MSNFVTLTKEEFEANLPDNFTIVNVPNCNEFVYQIPTTNTEVDVRVYSTVDYRTGVTRDIGADAIRVVFWEKTNDRPIGKGKKILRVEGRTSIGQRLQDRIAEFMGTANDQDVVNFEYVRAVLSHNAVNWMDFAQGLLESLVNYGRLTDGQLAYVLGDLNPKGKPTMEARVLAKDPGFKDQFAESQLEQAEVDVLVLGDSTVTIPIEEPEPEPETEPVVNFSFRDDPDGNDDWLAQSRGTPTAEYPFFNYPFETFNPVQSEVLPYADKENNLVIGANTSAGKTICAELLMDVVLLRGKKIVYLSPLKSLTQEKYDDWQKRYPDEKITILTGDYVLSERKKAELADSTIIVMTSEMCDSRTRRMKAEKNYWLKQVGLVIVDESHILSTDRGHAVEAGLMRFTAINHNARILLLSATMPNVAELGEWLTVMNGKPTDVVFSTWRPVELNMNYCEYQVAYRDYWTTQSNKMNMVVDIAQSKPNEKFLIFTHDKGTGRRIVKMLRDLGEETFFHNADLDLEDRLDIETKFADRENGIRILVSTSTLAWGRNLPARNVIITGIHRGLNEVDELDIIQMAGRAGRYGIDDAGFVFLLLPEGATEEWRERFMNPRPVRSVLAHFFPFHVISEIETKTIREPQDLYAWYNRSLLAKQNDEDYFTSHDATELMDRLLNMEMITSDDGRIVKATGLGRVCSWLYFSPQDVYKWYQNFDAYFKNGLYEEPERDRFLAWAIGDIPSNDWGYIPKDVQPEAQSFAMPLVGRSIRPTSAIIAAIATYAALTGEEVPDALKSIRRQIVFDIDRIGQALALIDKMHASWNRDLWETLPLRVKYGVPEEVVPLTRIKKVGGKRALSLYQKGFTTIESISKAKLKDLTKVLTPALAREIKANAKARLLEDAV